MSFNCFVLFVCVCVCGWAAASLTLTPHYFYACHAEQKNKTLKNKVVEEY